MKKRLNIFIIIIIAVFSIIAGCNKEGNIENADEIKQQILNKMGEQNDYSFAATTSIGMSGSDVEDLVKINGFISAKKNTYFALNISSFEGMPEEKMELAKKGDKMLVKYAEEEKWTEVTKEEMVVYSEFENWSPEFNLSLIKDISLSTEAIANKEDLKGIRVKVDPNKMKEQVIKQMRAGLSGEGLSPEEIEQMKTNLGLTDDEIAEMEKELKGQIAESQKQLEEMIATLTVDSSYEIYYDPKSFLIQEMTHQTKSKYKVEEQNFDETVVLKMTFSNYGTKKELPIS